jgi:uroporphyrinogen-III synthase
LKDAGAASLLGLAVLVTRPAQQAAKLCARISALGGSAIAFPTIAIEPQQPAPLCGTPPDVVIFTSVNAVRYGLERAPLDANTRVAAIGTATAAALAAQGRRPDIVPASGHDSESLLADPRLAGDPGKSAVIVRGVGGRELLLETLRARGWSVATLEVYRRVLPAHSTQDIGGLEARWARGGVDVVTATSVETLQNLARLLSPEGIRLFVATPCVVVSDRIAEAAARLGVGGELIRATAPDDEAIVDALLRWRRAHPGPHADA